MKTAVFGEQEPDGRVGKTEPDNGLVDEAGAAQNDDPGIGAGDGRNHQRHDDEADHATARGGRQRDDGIGRGIADDRRHGSHDRAELQRAPEDGAVELAFKEAGIGRQRPASLGAKALGKQDAHGNEKNDRREDRRGQRQRQSFHPILKHVLEPCVGFGGRPTARPRTIASA